MPVQRRLTLPRMASILCLRRQWPESEGYRADVARIADTLNALGAHEREAITRVVLAETDGTATPEEIRAAWLDLFGVEATRHGRQ